MKTAMQEWNEELLKRLLTIKSEPDGNVRETMINNFLIDDDIYLEKEKVQILNTWNTCNNDWRLIYNSEKYYNETFKN